MKEENHKEKLKRLVQELKEHGKEKGTKITNEFIAEALGYNRSYFSQLLGEKGVVTEDHIKDFRLHFPIEKEKKSNYLEERRNHKLNHVKDADITVYQIGTKASFIDIYDDEHQDQPIGKLNSSVFPGCNHAERITGSSMYPMIVNQAMVVGEKLNDARGISSGEIYVIHTNRGLRTCKYVHTIEKKPEEIKLVALNKNVPPQTIPVADITLIMRVYFIINPS